MQTFFPYSDPRRSAAVLDDRRLGKQRVETFQILRALTWPSYGWKNHPAVRMWRGFVPGLVAYGLVGVEEWRARGRADATQSALLEFSGGVEPQWDTLHDEGRLPPWVGDEAMHLSHRSALVRKHPDHYRPYFGDVPDDLPYVWPDPAFPRWPVLRGADEPLTPGDAATLLGLDEPPAGSEALVGLLAGLCTPGSTIWVVDQPALERTGPPPALRETAGVVSSSIAREPSPADRWAMEQEAEVVPEFHFVRRGLVTPSFADDLGAGLVVTPPGCDPGQRLGRPRLVMP